MFADTDAIRAWAAANAARADDLAEVVAALSSLPVAASGSSLGPVASRFLSALSAAAADGARAAAAISDQLASAGETTKTVASAYDSVDTSAAKRVAGG
jgi:hypothetical protein